VKELGLEPKCAGLRHLRLAQYGQICKHPKVPLSPIPTYLYLSTTLHTSHHFLQPLNYLATPPTSPCPILYSQHSSTTLLLLQLGCTFPGTGTMIFQPMQVRQPTLTLWGTWPYQPPTPTTILIGRKILDPLVLTHTAPLSFPNNFWALLWFLCQAQNFIEIKLTKSC